MTGWGWVSGGCHQWWRWAARGQWEWGVEWLVVRRTEFWALTGAPRAMSWRAVARRAPVARCSGVSPAASRAPGLAPASSSSWATSAGGRAPPAPWSGVRPAWRRQGVPVVEEGEEVTRTAASDGRAGGFWGARGPLVGGAGARLVGGGGARAPLDEDGGDPRRGRGVERTEAVRGPEGRAGPSGQEEADWGRRRWKDERGDAVGMGKRSRSLRRGSVSSDRSTQRDQRRAGVAAKEERRQEAEAEGQAEAEALGSPTASSPWAAATASGGTEPSETSTPRPARSATAWAERRGRGGRERWGRERAKSGGEGRLFEAIFFRASTWQPFAATWRGDWPAWCGRSGGLDRKVGVLGAMSGVG